MIDLAKNLDSNEKLVLMFRPSRKAYILQYASYGLLFVISLAILILLPETGHFYLLGLLAMALALVMLLRLEYRIWSRSYGISNQKLLYSKGIFSEKFKSARHNFITDVSLSQTLWDKIMNTGTVYINTAGSHGYEIRYRKISDPFNVKKIINDMMPSQAPAAAKPLPSRKAKLNAFGEKQ